MIRQPRLIKNGATLLCALLTISASVAQSPAPTVSRDNQPHPDLTGRAEQFALIKRFDFDERKLGNYEDTPLHWVQQRGDGLPVLFARGQLDDEIGRSAAPSFRLDIATGSVGYEYQHLDLTIIPECDYSLVGYICADKLQFAGAFAVAYFVDRSGTPIQGSHRVSQIVRATGQNPEPWQRISIDLPGDFATAYALRLQFWIMQDHAWRETEPEDIDPIVRRDVYARAWFDDFSVYRLPRVNLRLSNPAGLIAPGRREEIVLDVNNVTSHPLRMTLTVTDQFDQLCHAAQIEVLPMVSPSDFPSEQAATRPVDNEPGEPSRRYISAVREPLPELPPGIYSVRLRVLIGAESLLTRSTKFTVLPPLPEGRTRSLDLGVDLGPWRESEYTGVVELLTGLGCGAVKVGVPMVGDIEGGQRTAYFRQLNTLVRALAEERIDTTGVMLAPAENGDLSSDNSARAMVVAGDAWHDLSGPVLAHFGALLPTWQLGAEEIELRDGQLWTPADVESVRRHLRTFVSFPRIAIPQPVTAVSPPEDDIVSVWIPANLPTRTLPRMLDFLVEGATTRYWLQLSTDYDRGLNSRRRLDNLVRRLVLAKSLNPARVFLPAPFELSDCGGQPAWQPTEDYLVYRTLFHYLSGKAAAAAMTPAPHTLAIVFRGTDSSCLVIWAWEEDISPELVELYLGPDPHAVTIRGERRALEVVDGRARIPVGPTPLIVDCLDTSLALLQCSYHLRPTYVQLHQPEPRPVLTFRNTFDAPLSGEILLTPPGDWQIEPSQCSFVLAPGETFTEALTLTPPPRQIAQSHDLDVRLILHTPEVAELHFPTQLTVGLRDINLEASAHWSGNDLVLRQALRNLSPSVVSFNAYCDPPGRARLERFFKSIAPGESAVQTYLIPNARDLAGRLVPMGIGEIGGPRNLNQFAEVPQ